MPELELHPAFLTKNGRKQFAILPYSEYRKLQDELEDLADIRALDEARAQEGHLPGISLQEVRQRLDAKFPRSAKGKKTGRR